MVKTYRRQQREENGKQRKKNILFISIGFALGFLIASSAILNSQVSLHHINPNQPTRMLSASAIRDEFSAKSTQIGSNIKDLRPSPASLQDVRILVAIAAFDFTQIPHLEEVLDSYHDVCVGGAIVDIVIHATVAYPVTLIDLLNSRFTCENFSLEIVLKPSSLRLHLVDCHRKLFYDKISDYDLFIYTEEDIQVTPRTVSTYLQESRHIQQIMEQDTASAYSFSDFNVGIVRYEYNFPSNVVIDDKTRHSIQNVTRVYWEHSSAKSPMVPNTVDVVKQTKEMSERYVTMGNHHQGMFLATRDLLLAWKDRKNCNFDVVKNRPGTNSQPAEGTQRVWMSSQQLFGSRHCNVQQVLPMDKFGALTVLHVPNKNYRRVGKYRKRKFSDGTEEFDINPDLLTALQLHLEVRKQLRAFHFVHLSPPCVPSAKLVFYYLIISWNSRSEKHGPQNQRSLTKVQ